jgi:biopolymer transport protein ExbD
VAFKRLDTEKRKMQLVSLIDMAFILLLFFMVTIFVAQLLKQEQKIFVPTPKNEPGRAQIFIQLLEDNNFVWIDKNATNVVERAWNRIENADWYWPLSPKQKEKRKTEIALKALLRKNSGAQLESKLKALVTEARETGAKYFAIIRCPNDVPYSRVVDIIKILSLAETIEYGCIGGTLDQISNCRSVQIVREKTKQGEERDNLWIDF